MVAAAPGGAAMTQQYRTLGEGDVRLPGYEWRRRESRDGWKGDNDLGVGLCLDRADAEINEYRVPCSATVAPDGYEIVQRERLPQGARVGVAWLYWLTTGEEWRPTNYAGAKLASPPIVFETYAAPADELRELYAQGNAERERPVPVGDGWRVLGDDELIANGDETSECGAPWKEVAAFEDHRAAGVFGSHNRYRRRVAPQPVEQHSTAAAVPWVSAAVRQPPADTAVMVRFEGGVVGVYYRHGSATMRADWYWLDLAAVDRLAAENAALVRERDAARMDAAAAMQRSAEASAELERLRKQRDSLYRDAKRIVAAAKSIMVVGDEE